MAETAPAAGAELAGGNYEVIRRRLAEAARELSGRASALNDRRKAAFGSTELVVLGQGRVRTENNCVPVGICQVGGRLLFGYNVFLGLRRDIAVGDLFSLHALEAAADGFELPALSADDPLSKTLLGDPTFQREFAELFQTWREARLRQLRQVGGKLLAVVQVGRTLKDIRVFRWALSPSGPPTYLDNRGERDHSFPPTFDFTWTRATRESHVAGRFPHVSILDEIFVETLGGDLTIKVENNTATGKGIYSEPVQDPNQSLDDAEIWYARIGALILIKVLPFQESAWRWLVFNRRTGTVLRLDAIGLGCLTLPEDQGLIFPGGVYLQTGEHKLFDGDMSGLEVKRVVRSPNGEDVLYVFYRPADGRYLLLPYNLIRKAVATPILADGYTLFDDGRLVVFRAVGEPTRVHPMQVWQTPFTSDEFAAAKPRDGSFLGRIGNAELVRGLSDLGTLVALVEHPTPTRPIYEDLVAAAGRLRDAYHWLGSPEVGDLLTLVDGVRRTAELIIDEFEKVLALRKRAVGALEAATEQQQRLLATVRPEDWRTVEAFMSALTALRQQRGHLITLREVRFIDLAAIEALERSVVEAFDQVSRGVVTFLLEPEALNPLRARVEALHAGIGEARKTADFQPLEEEIARTGAGLDLVAEVVGGLTVGDAVARATALEDISEVYGLLNRVRATLAGRKTEVVGAESRAEFSAQYKLLGQSVASGLALCDSPERADEQLSRLLLALEELEGRFGEIDEFSAELQKKREEIIDALGARKQTLLDERQRRIGNLMAAAERILEGVARRARTIKAEDELNATFASDPMVLKLRQLSEQLSGLGDTVKSEEVLARLKATWQTALRALRDRLDLFEAGENLVKFGRFKFTVNTQPIELALVPRGDGLALHLSGTDFYEPLVGPEIDASRPLWSQTVVSETDEVYRAEYLAATLLFDAESGRRGSVAELSEAALREGGLLERVRGVAAERYDEGYERGIHDHDAALILGRLLDLRGSAGLLRFPSLPRAAAMVFWAWQTDRGLKDIWHRSARSLGRVQRALGPSPAAAALARDLAARIDRFVRELRLHEALGEAWGDAEAALAGRYLVEELGADRPRFVVSPEAIALRAALFARVEEAGGRSAFDDDLRALEKSLAERLALAAAWVAAVVQADPALAGHREAVTEAAVAIVTERDLDQDPSSARTAVTLTGLVGQHPRVQGGNLELRLDEFLSRLVRFVAHRAPAFRAWRDRKTELLAVETRRLRIAEFKPRIMTSFVRNRLINEVYLPLIGANLAKQLGAAGEAKRTDLMGLLLLVSPPGYGKTTLMEYVASQLGLVFMKVNGPALGHAVTSLDPAEAPNATARQEVDKINLALEMGNNVMLYLDDIQHTHPELLQKFISLCDAQRKIEGVWRGATRTYDMRGKKFCVVMAGNPYTESGEKFQIPDMLANRADTYNLGDILEGRDDLFALSYLENALTSNPVLAPLAARPASDLAALLRMAQGHEVPSSELSHGYSAVEIGEITGVFRHLFRVQAVLLKVNLEYIRSASMSDAFRTEPPFKLQGSYRNMAKLTEKVVAAMTEAEVERLIDDHYQGESQTLTAGAEQNLLKLAELRGRSSPEQQTRWDEVKRAFSRVQLMGGKDADPVTRVTGTLTGLGQQLEGIRSALDPATREKLSDPLRLVAAQVQGLKNAVVEGKGAAPLLAPVSALGVELAGLRQGLDAATRGLAALNLADWILPSIEQIRDEHDVAKLRGAMVESAMTALGDPGAMPVERRDIALASALPVIHNLAVQIHDLSSAHLPPDARERFMDALRVEFARVIAALSGLSSEAD